MTRGARVFAPRMSVMGLVMLLALLAVGLWAAACGGSTPATTTSVAVVDETTADATTSSAVTTEQPAGSETTETSTAGSETTETSTGGEAPVINLGKDDFGNEVVLHVGDRVRIDLKPYVNDRVKSVRWDYVPICVQETDSGMDVISDVVVACWLELEAGVAGPVTVRAEYEFPYGTKKAAWVVYLIVQE